MSVTQRLRSIVRSVIVQLLIYIALHLRLQTCLISSLRTFIGSHQFVFMSFGTAVSVGHVADSMRSAFFQCD